MSCIRPETVFGKRGRRRCLADTALIVLSDAASGLPGEILAAGATPAMSAQDTNVMSRLYIVGFRGHTTVASRMLHTAVVAFSLLIRPLDANDATVKAH